jgi:hypothetical protein
MGKAQALAVNVGAARGLQSVLKTNLGASMLRTRRLARDC